MTPFPNPPGRSRRQQALTRANGLKVVKAHSYLSDEDLLTVVGHLEPE